MARRSKSGDDNKTDDLDPNEETRCDNGDDEMEFDFESEEIKPKGPTLWKIEVPTLEELGLSREDYEVFLDEPESEAEESSVDPRVVQVLKELEHDDGALWYEVEFDDGATREVPFDRLTTLENGIEALSRFSSNDQTNSRAVVLESEDEESSFKDARALRKRNLLSLQNKRKAEMASRSASVDELSEDEIVISASSIPRRSARATRSQGLGEVQMLPYNDTGRYSDDDLAPERPIRRSSRPATRNAAAQEFFKKKSRGRKGDSDDDYESEEGVTRRSDRTKRQNVQYTEVNPEDDFEETVEVRRPKPKVLHSKEIFPVLQDDEFAELHNPQCDTCKYIGHSKERGTLVYCQGCSATFHKDCIGQRTWRDHLVTKISSENFVLQCKRCIGKYKLKDSLEASYDRCTVCHQQGLSCKPFKSLKEKKKAPAHDSRELTPDTSVDEDLLYNPQNVLFRCSECFRAWHYEHLPPLRGSKSRQGETKEDREKRVREYIENFQCIECSTKPGKLSNIIAWRPADPVAREGGETTDLSLFDEDEREYLIKFEDQSYFHAKWYPGPWVAGAFPQKRRGFLKSNPSAVMTREEAIPEDWLRVEIVLDVQYTSIVPHGDVEVDLRRVREVEKALIKYRGLPYEQVFWDDPPKESDKERWAHWARAYEDYIRGMYIHPPKNIAKRVEKARRSKFCPLKAQPKYITGGTLMEYQMEGMNWLYYKWCSGQNAILADEMGLGKTIQIVSFLAVLFKAQNIWPFLIVVPHSTVPNWKREIQTWAPDLRVVAYFGTEASRRLTSKHEMFHKNGDLKCHVVVTSYMGPTSDSGVLRKIPWQCLVVDEGQRLKNDDTQLYNELQKYRIQQKVLLTGTPLQNNPRELFNLLQFLEPKEMNADALEEEFGTLTNENVPKLHSVIRPFFLRRTKAQVLTHLPPMAEVIVPVSMTPLQRKLYKSILSKDATLIRAILYKGDKVKPTERAKLNNLLMQLRKCVCHPYLYNSEIEEDTTGQPLDEVFGRLVEAGSKLGLLNIMLPKLKERGHRVLMFSQFLGMIDIVEDFLNHLGLKFHRLDGSVSTLEKQKRIDEFNAPGSDYFAFLLSTRAGGVGINLATADTVIILDPDFNPHQDIQALSRAHRIGQKNKVLVFHLMTRDTAEEKIMQIGKKKLSLDHLIIEKMGGENGVEEEVIDVESILSFGAKRLFDDDEGEDRVIKYDDESVDKLLDRSQIEQTKTTDANGGSGAENAFSFARVWANDKGSLEETEEVGEDETPEPGFWDRVLKEREEEARREEAAKQEELGRGRRRRKTTNVNYAMVDDVAAAAKDGDDNDSDTDYMAEDKPDSADESEPEVQVMDHDDMMMAGIQPANIRHPAQGLFVPPLPINLPQGLLVPAPPYPQSYPYGQPPPMVPHSQPPPMVPHSQPTPMPHVAFKRTPIIPPRPFDTIPNLSLPRCLKCKNRHAQGSCPRKQASRPSDTMPNNSLRRCQACKNQHASGACPLKQAGVEKCPMCKLPHLPSVEACPHMMSETQLNQMMTDLRNSNEPPEEVEAAKSVVRKQLKLVRTGKRRGKAMEIRETGVGGAGAGAGAV